MVVTEKKKIKISKECIDHPVYLCWLNSLGGYSYWLFFNSHVESVKTRNLGIYKSNIIDLENSIGNQGLIGKSANPFLTVGARVVSEDMDGIKGLFISPKVLMLSNPHSWQTDGVKWKRVKVNTGSLVVLRTDTYALDVEFNLELPELNTQFE